MEAFRGKKPMKAVEETEIRDLFGGIEKRQSIEIFYIEGKRILSEVSHTTYRNNNLNYE